MKIITRNDAMEQIKNNTSHKNIQILTNTIKQACEIEKQLVTSTHVDDMKHLSHPSEAVCTMNHFIHHKILSSGFLELTHGDEYDYELHDKRPLLDIITEITNNTNDCNLRWVLNVFYEQIYVFHNKTASHYETYTVDEFLYQKIPTIKEL